MSGQYPLSKERQELILKILAEAGVETSSPEQEENASGKLVPFHRDVSIKVCSYDDESDDYDMYIQVD